MTKPLRNSMVVAWLGILPGCALNDRQIELDDEAADGESGTEGTGDTGGTGEELSIDGDSTSSESTSSESTTDESTTGECGPDMSGIYLFALDTTLGPDLPLQYVLTLDLTYAGDCSATGDFSFQSLSLDQTSQTQPREFVGDPLVVQGVTLDALGHFSVDMGMVMVDGEANPITGSDAVVQPLLDGDVVHVDALCGTVSGMLISPLEYDLAGSTFAAIRLDDDGSDPVTLPLTFPYRCDQVPPP